MVAPHAAAGAAGATLGVDWAWIGSQLQSTETGAHAFGCAIVDTVHDGTLMIPSYFLAVGILQGDTLAQARANLMNEWLNSWGVGASFWIPFMYCNFAMVRPQYRVRMMAAANTVWSVLIDYMAHRSKAHDDDQGQPLDRDRRRQSPPPTPPLA